MKGVGAASWQGSEGVGWFFRPVTMVAIYLRRVVRMVVQFLPSTVVVVEGITTTAAAGWGWTDGGWALRGLVLGGGGRRGVLVFYFFFKFFYFYYLYSSHHIRYSFFVIFLNFFVCMAYALEKSASPYNFSH